jgi:adenine-specific DNA glycosylase
VTESPGTLGDEAVKLLDAVQDWARRNLGDGAHIATGAPECTWCPICQFIAVLRGERPEVNDKIADAATSLIAAVRAVVDAAAPSQSARSRAPRVQHIDLGQAE